MSSTSARPKVFRLPVAEPEAQDGRARQLFDWLALNKPAVSITLVLALMAVTMTGLSKENKAKPEQLKKNEDNFTFFAPDAQRARGADQPFVIKDENSEIVGQITKIPAEGEELNQIKSTTDVDNRTQRDLLSVVNKH